MHALHYANELLLRVRLAFQKLLQTRQTSRNYQKPVLVMIKHCLGNSQINSIPAWSKEFSYITFSLQNTCKSFRVSASRYYSFTARNLRHFRPWKFTLSLMAPRGSQDLRSPSPIVAPALSLPPLSLILDFGKQNTRGISVSLACCWQIGSKSTNHSPIAWRREG